MGNSLKRIDAKEVELPETLYVRDIENKVFQSIVVQCLLNIEGVGLVEGNLLDYFLGREPAERISGISVEQDPKTHSIQVKIEVSVAYGIVIPEKAQEIHQKVAEQLSHLTGLHVSLVHVIFKSLITKGENVEESTSLAPSEYSDAF